ncbi:Crp/Fnr family transcriptional regulator [Bradyrhizobium brasilense]|uniref:Crp/Fnr family transcriptional regulator n=1 Tax=Bradyrhizobium brasilense TaxID=1419277 RepID=UPI00287732AF|nr:Crp/Fnr family transcriptional regulator [Bradyrhizobium brasilense]MCP3413626.1 Crp/Fnr family transcriptional regulator [Bradyrhizobium brasilense]
MTDHMPTVLEVPDCSGDGALKRGAATQPIFHGPLTVGSKKQASLKNAILARLSLEDLAAMGGSLEPIVLKERMVLQEPKRPVEHVYFMESGLVSLRVIAAGSMLETAVIGYRGAVGTSLLWGGHISSHQSVVLFPGSAYRIPVENLRRLMKERPGIRERLFEYLQALTFQCVQAGLCGVRHNREQRLASWLCLASDAVDACVLPVTHDYLSSVLGVRRAGVTETLIRFEQQGVIRKMRGVLQIDQRESLEQKTCCCYKLVSSAYASSLSAFAPCAV